MMKNVMNQSQMLVTLIIIPTTQQQQQPDFTYFYSYLT